MLLEALGPLDFFVDLTNPALSFLPKALFVSVLSALVAGVIGVHVILRGMAFVGDAVAHAVFPGLAIAFVLQGSLLLGGAAAGFATALLIALFAAGRRLKTDAVIGVFFAGAFALGVVIISQVPGYTGSLQQFLFGSLTGISIEDMALVAVTATVVVSLAVLFHKELVAVGLDRSMAAAMRLPLVWLDVLLYMLVTAAVVISVQTIGNILVLALLVTPAATARMLTDRLGVMMVLSPAIGAACSLVGLYLSWTFDTPAGATIVLVATVAFVTVWLAAPRHGVLWERRRFSRVGAPSTG